MSTCARTCPALLIAAPASGQGKTTVTAALARLYSRQGQRVRVFKCGPDFLDPMILATASGQPVYQLDLWMVGETDSRRLLWEAAGEAELILIEGVMGLFDGSPSAADLACRLGIPVLAVIDATAMAQTFAAVAHGLASFQPELPFAGVLANRVGSAAHATLLRNSLPAHLPWFGALPRNSTSQLPSRHLGLVQAAEVADLMVRLDQAADALAASFTPVLPAPVTFLAPQSEPLPALLQGVRIGVAQDAALGFLYRANLDMLQQLGAKLHFFSPLRDAALPEIDSLYLPGGYPELHLPALNANQRLHWAIQRHHADGKPILAECGGLLYLLEALTDLNGQRTELLGLLPGEAIMQPRLSALALQAVQLPEGCLRGHTFHHSQLHTALTPLARASTPNGRPVSEAVYRLGRLTATYIHLYLPSNPQAAAALFRP